jgi:hypothetical protein
VTCLNLHAFPIRYQTTSRYLIPALCSGSPVTNESLEVLWGLLTLEEIELREKANAPKRQRKVAPKRNRRGKKNVDSDDEKGDGIELAEDAKQKRTKMVKKEGVEGLLTTIGTGTDQVKVEVE